MEQTTPRAWLPITGWEGLYEVSDDGLVRSLPRTSIRRNGSAYTVRGCELKPQPDRDGYLQVRLTRPEGAATLKVHRLVAEAFIGPCPPGMIACHGDGNPANNVVGNLRWDTHSANRLDAVRHGTHNCASKTHCKRGHALSGPNLRVTNSGRSCRACCLALDLIRHHGVGDIQEISDRRYRELLAEAA